MTYASSPDPFDSTSLLLAAVHSVFSFLFFFFLGFLFFFAFSGVFGVSSSEMMVSTPPPFSHLSWYYLSRWAW